MTGKRKKRLDYILVETGFASTLHHARSLVMAGKVVVDDHRVDKPSTLISLSSRIRVKDSQSAYVSRGGAKLEKPLEIFNVSVAGKTVLDVGASTGGFTDCLLQKGASRIFAVDVGYGQLAWNLQNDNRVVSLDRTNIRNLSPDNITPLPGLAVIDASFISLKKIVPHVITLLTPKGEILALVKPQFEVKKRMVGKGGIVRDKQQFQSVIKDLVLVSRSLSLFVAGIMESPVPGQKGNREFFMYMRKC